MGERLFSHKFHGLAGNANRVACQNCHPHSIDSVNFIDNSLKRHFSACFN